MTTFEIMLREMIKTLTFENGCILLDSEYGNCVDCGAGPYPPIEHEPTCIVSLAKRLQIELGPWEIEGKENARIQFNANNNSNQG